ncbi:discoidin domain-containing protein [Streptomyces antarcticus]|uniref:discoidin domain-containing protein n=1 Tax=Streptomyces antarcticus TaxID=2996458 RepID=UPI00226D557B|nr:MULTISPECIES: discoidin domain-containing protein [unclassified Streptomyces]MCY0944792.1 discoidin domain-containing protein [Streptomyces sp. H34-AA3]MCZ4081174.1 discoidin domain-containing protein [Streptomyces sp. H34-S5]
MGNTITQSHGGMKVCSGGLTVQGSATISDALTAKTLAARTTVSAGLPTASTNMGEDAGRGVERALDGNDDTIGMSDRLPVTGEWFMVDLKGTRRITKIEIRFGMAPGGANQLLGGEVQTSTDGHQWVTQGSCSMIPMYCSTPSALNARYVRVLVL